MILEYFVLLAHGLILRLLLNIWAFLEGLDEPVRFRILLAFVNYLEWVDRRIFFCKWHWYCQTIQVPAWVLQNEDLQRELGNR